MRRRLSPQVKKARSLAHDRRNTYGECPTSARRSIRRRKRWDRHVIRQAERREIERDPLEASATAPAQRAFWRKTPDTSLGEVLYRRRLRRFLGDLAERVASDSGFLERLELSAEASATADLDGDGLLDLVLATEDEMLLYYAQDVVGPRGSP